jgi:hypothetical protein
VTGDESAAGSTAVLAVLRDRVRLRRGLLRGVPAGSTRVADESDASPAVNSVLGSGSGWLSSTPAARSVPDIRPGSRPSASAESVVGSEADNFPPLAPGMAKIPIVSAR